MSLVNDLIRRARQQPDELTIRPNQVRPLAAHCESCLNHVILPPPKPIAEIEADIREGRMRFMDIPVRVLKAGRRP